MACSLWEDYGMGGDPKWPAFDGQILGFGIDQGLGLG